MPRKTTKTWDEDHIGEFRTEVGIKYYVADGVRVAKKVGDDWIALVPGWHVDEGYSSDGGRLITSVEYDPDRLE